MVYLTMGNSGLPFTDRLIGDMQLICQLFLGHPFFLAQLKNKRANFFLSNSYIYPTSFLHYTCTVSFWQLNSSRIPYFFQSNSSKISDHAVGNIQQKPFSLRVQKSCHGFGRPI